MLVLRWQMLSNMILLPFDSHNQIMEIKKEAPHRYLIVLFSYISHNSQGHLLKKTGAVNQRPIDEEDGEEVAPLFISIAKLHDKERKPFEPPDVWDRSEKKGGKSCLQFAEFVKWWYMNRWHGLEMLRWDEERRFDVKVWTKANEDDQGPWQFDACFPVAFTEYLSFEL